MQPRQHSCLLPPPARWPTWFPILRPLLLSPPSTAPLSLSSVLLSTSPLSASSLVPGSLFLPASLSVPWFPKPARRVVVQFGRFGLNPCSPWLRCVEGIEEGDRRSSPRETGRKKDSFDQCLLSVLSCRGGRRRRKRYKYIYFQPSLLRGV